MPIIKKGQHEINENGWLPKLHFGQKFLRYDVKFGKDCIYDLGYDLGNLDQYDINKLFGLSYGRHHRNSARFGWRWDIEKTMIEILAYVYDGGKRLSDVHITHVHPNMSYRYMIMTTKQEYVFMITSERNNSRVVKVEHGNLPFWGYYLDPSFGGNSEAPHDMHIDMRQV